MRGVARDVIWQVIGRVMSAGAGFVVLLILTRYLDPLRYGDYGTILAFFAFISSLSDFGLYSRGVRELAKHKPGSTSENILYSKIVRSRLTMIGMIYLAALAIAYMIPAYHQNIYLMRGLPLGMLFSGLAMAAGVITLPLQLRTNMHHASGSLILARLGQLLFLGWLVGRGIPDANIQPLLSFVMVMLSIVISSGLQRLYTWRFARRDMTVQRTPSRDFLWTMIRGQRRYGIGFFLGSASTMVVSVIISLRYPTISGYQLIGIWTFAMQMYAILLIIPPAVGNSLLRHTGTHTAEQLNRTFSRGLLSIGMIGCLIVLGFWGGGRWGMSLIGAKNYLTQVEVRTDFTLWLSQSIGSDIVLGLMGIALLAHFLKIGQQFWIVAQDKQEILLRINGIAFLLGSIIARLAVGERGLRGAVIGQASFDTIAFVLGMWYFRDRPLLGFADRVQLGGIIAWTGLCVVAMVWTRIYGETIALRSAIGIITIRMISVAYPFWRQWKKT